MNMIAISVKPTFMTRCHKCPYRRNNKNLMFLKEMSCSCFFLEYLVWWLHLYLCKLRLMSILICHMFHNQQTLCSYNWNLYNNTLLLELIFTFPPWYELLLCRTTCLSLIINFKLRFPRSIIRCWIWSIGTSRKKMSIYSYIVCYLSRPKSLASSILNIHDIISSKYCLKLFFSHIDTVIISIPTSGLLLNTSRKYIFSILLWSSFFELKHFNLCTQDKPHRKRCLNFNQMKIHHW